MPRNFTAGNSEVIVTLFMGRIRSGLVRLLLLKSMTTFKFLFLAAGLLVNKINCVLSGCNDNLFSLKKVTTFLNSEFTREISSSMLSEQAKRVVSSAKSRENKAVHNGRSLIFMINNIGPRIEPWGTPIVTSIKSLDMPSITTNCLRLDR